MHLRQLTLTLSILLFTEGVASSDTTHTGTQLKEALESANQSCLQQVSTTEERAINLRHTTAQDVGKDEFWYLPSFWRPCVIHWRHCKALKALNMSQPEYTATMGQFKDFTTSQNKILGEKIQKYENNPQHQGYEIAGEIRAFGTGCTNLSKGIEQKLKERSDLIKKIF